MSKGVSPIISTLLLIVIAVCAAVVTYAFVTGFIGTATSQSQSQQPSCVDSPLMNKTTETLTPVYKYYNETIQIISKQIIEIQTGWTGYSHYTYTDGYTQDSRFDLRVLFKSQPIEMSDGRTYAFLLMWNDSRAWCVDPVTYNNTNVGFATSIAVDPILNYYVYTKTIEEGFWHNCTQFQAPATITSSIWQTTGTWTTTMNLTEVPAGTWTVVNITSGDQIHITWYNCTTGYCIGG
jgi:flagellin-like protein